jgi:holo-[acyl-carrier protein] synthase
LSFSVGVDIVEIERIQTAVETHGERFLTRIFSPDEIALCMERAGSIACLAARFAAKEALRKAIRASISVPGRYIVVLPEHDGGPKLLLPRVLVDKLGGDFTVSLSHSRDYAVAVVLWEKR